LISVHTFAILFLRKTPPRWACLLAVGLSWLLVLFITIVGPAIIAPARGKGAFYGNSGAWCWIAARYQVERFFFLCGAHLDFDLDVKVETNAFPTTSFLQVLLHLSQHRHELAL
jgi:hypothetical protein